MVDVSVYRAVSRGILVNSGIPNVRFKSDDSIERKYDKTLKNGLGFSQCFNDLIGMRLRFQEYPKEFPPYFRLVDLRNGKKLDDGYRAIQYTNIQSLRLDASCMKSMQMGKSIH